MSTIDYNNGLTAAILGGAGLGLRMSEQRQQGQQFQQRMALDQQSQDWQQQFNEQQAATHANQFAQELAHRQAEEQRAADAAKLRAQMREEEAGYFRVLNREMLGMQGQQAPPPEDALGGGQGLGFQAAAPPSPELSGPYRTLIKTIDHGGPEVQRALYEHLKSDQGKRKVLAVIDQIHRDPRFAGAIDKDRAPALSLLASAFAEIDHPDTALTMARGLETQAAEQAKQTKRMDVMARSLATKPGKDGQPQFDQNVYQQLLVMDPQDLERTYTQAAQQQLGIRGHPGGIDQQPDQASIKYFEEAQRLMYSKESTPEERQRGTAMMLAANKSVDRPEVSLGNREKATYSAGQVTAAKDAWERASKALDRADKARDYSGRPVNEKELEAAQKAEAAAFETYQAIRRGDPIAADTGGAPQVKPSDTLDIGGRAVPVGEIGLTPERLKALGSAAWVEFQSSKGRAPDLHNAGDLAELKKIRDRLIGKAPQMSGNPDPATAP